MKNITNNEQSNLIERIQAVRIKLASLEDENVEGVEAGESLCAKSDEWLNKDILLDEEISVEYCDHLECDCQNEETTEYDFANLDVDLDESSEEEFRRLSILSELLDKKMVVNEEMSEVIDKMKLELDEHHKTLDDALNELLIIAKEMEICVVNANL